MYQLTLSPFVRRMCPLLECVSEITNPFGLMRDCLFFISFFFDTCIVTPALACVLFFFVCLFITCPM